MRDVDLADRLEQLERRVAELERHQSGVRQPFRGPRLTTCRGCQARVFWARTPKGRKALVDEAQALPPEDSKAPAYRIQFVDGSGTPLLQKIPPTKDGSKPAGYILHFTTCPEADRFSGGRR